MKVKKLMVILNNLGQLLNFSIIHCFIQEIYNFH